MSSPSASRRRPSALPRNDLAGIHDSVRVEQLLDPAVERQEVTVLALEIAELAVADAMLAGAGPAARERVLHERRVQGLGARDRRRVVGIEQKGEVEVAVADVADDAAAQPGRIERAPRGLDCGRELG